MSQLESHEYAQLLAIAERLHGTLDLRRAIDAVAPLLQRLVNAEHVAIAISRPGGMYDYEWYNTTLPASFLGSYEKIMDRDFVRHAVAAAPNRVLIDQQMITRKEFDRHIVNQHARSTGANVNRVMGVMLAHEQEWSSGLALYRTNEEGFSEHDAKLLQHIVPHIANAVRTTREHSAVLREVWLEPVLHHAGVAAIWVDRAGREVTRTPYATALLERYFAPHERPAGALPEALRDYALQYIARRTEAIHMAPFVRERDLNSMRASVVPLRDAGMWAIVLQPRGLDEVFAAKLSPRQCVIAGYILRGLSNQEIAEREQRKLATIKDQANAVYERLGVSGRKGLIALASGLGAEPT